MNIKELAQNIEKNKKLISGHRSCSGCGFPQIVRAVLASTDKPVVVACATGCLEVTTTIYPFTSWNVPFVHSAFENAAVTIAGAESAYNALKRKREIKDEIKFVAFGGDGGTYDIGLQSLSGTLERGHDMLYVLYDNQAYMNCLSLDSFIMTKDGLKRITKIREGDLIYAFNQKNGDLVLKKCTWVFDNGTKKVYELSTFHHTIKATSNHPFLVVKRKGRGKENKLVWKTLAELTTKDEIIVLKKLSREGSYKFPAIKLSKKGDYKVNKINYVKIPKISSIELMEFLGLYVGDGWVRSHKAEIGFAIPENTQARKRLKELYRRIFKKELIGRDKNYIYIYSINLAKFIDSLGFGKGAKNKIIPDWVFTLPQKEKEAFLRGLILSDGYKIGNSCRYVSASYDLLKSLRLLLQTIGYQVGKIHQQTKKKGTHVVYRKLLEDSTYGYICFSKKKQPNIKKYLSQVKQRDFLADNKYFSTEKITSIRFVREEPTLDLRVEGEHNFIADGIVVHNTGVQRSSATPLGASTTTSPAGIVYQGKEEFRKDIAKVVAAHNIPYVAQTSVSNLIDLSNKAQKAFSIKGPKFIVCLQPCTLGWIYPMEQTIKIAKLAVESRFWPLYEIENGKYKLSYNPSNPIPVEEYLKIQGRFKHLFKPENRHIIEKIQKNVDEEWEKLLKLCVE